MIIKDTTNKIKSVYEDIKDGELDLRPNFQRGEVWTTKKKKLLIDSILREWYIPPIHTVSIGNGKAEVLDGQQRLSAIRDFLDNQFQIDGFIEPKDDDIVELNGKKFKDLPPDIQRKIERFGITIYEITDYNQGEPNELFYRLNQTIKLTSSEARNAIFGDVRDDMSSFVSYMDELDVDKNILGFSNSRMAYNDLLSRVCLLLEKKSIRYQLSDANLTNRYRNDTSFDNEISIAIKDTIRIFGEFSSHIKNMEVNTNLTKASSLNWIYLIACMNISGEKFDNNQIYNAFFNLESAKSHVKINEKIPYEILDFFDIDEQCLRELLMIYIERSSSRVMSIGSIIIRDIIQNFACFRSGINLSYLDKKDYDALDELSYLMKDKNLDVKYIVENLSENWKG
ncbi:Uncharacterized conserved protein [Serratia entomophila]|uniref:DUF262 domain-containing protein n=1 Tax=Serratia entomophila TaxID=42906 RepID=UPI00169D7F1C|nr:DUF262 domain-containing protein [Serratia entomophila]CAI1014526.1 Uncharacterized conserved protein [Serratia entomophila]CAI1774247.1 Uncharacterized conserved protein [Serratia entomophila]CAI1779798.1 Uncharacterized conserved protein [Serratia entomophila]CAI1837314.1 Uncharacterized conserved protein [Serratia entomophila]CAI2072539.1 Uncharacterized conserved protein [Serratia entomophila]